MYYEEAIIDGVLHIRSTPNGEWRKLSAEAITLKYMEVKREAAQHSVEPTLPSGGGSVREVIARNAESKKVR